MVPAVITFRHQLKSCPVCLEGAKSSKTVQYRVNCRGHLCKHGGRDHILPFSSAVYCQTSILVFHLFIALSWRQTVLFKSNFNPISWAVLIWLHRIPIYRHDAHRNRNLFDSIQFACQVCAICRFLLLKPNNICGTAHIWAMKMRSIKALERNICTTDTSVSSLFFFFLLCLSVPLELFTTWGHGDNSTLANERASPKWGKSKLMLMQCQRRLMANDKLKDCWSQCLFISMSPSQCYLSSCHHCQWVQSHSSSHPGTVEYDLGRLLC